MKNSTPSKFVSFDPTQDKILRNLEKQTQEIHNNMSLFAK